jgi:hypothetical protein
VRLIHRLPRSPLALLAIVIGLASVAPAVAQGPTPLSDYVPGEGVVFYAEFQGVDTHADAWKRSSAYKILNDTPTGSMFEDVMAQLLTQTILKTAKVKITGPEAVTLIKHVGQHGAVLSAFGKADAPGDQPGVLAVRGVFKNKETRPIVARLLNSAVDPKAKPKIVEVAGHKIVIQKNQGKGQFMGWWVDDVRKEDLVLIPPVSTEAAVIKIAGMVFATLDNKGQSVTNHPIRAALAKPEDGFVPVGLAFIDIASAMPPGSPPVLGLQGLKSVDYRWGFQEKETVSILRIHAPEPRQGVLALFDQPTFEKASLPPIPEGVTAFSVFSFSPKSLYDQVTTLAKVMNPQAGAQIDAVADQIKAKTRLRLKEDILTHLGPKMAVYVAPSPKTTADPNKAPSINALSAILGGAEIPRLTMIADIDDPVAFGRVLDELMIQVNQALRSATPAPPGAEPATGKAAAKGATAHGSGIEFKLIPGPTKVYMLSLPTSMSGMVPNYIKPTIRVGPKHVVFSISPDSARLALEVKSGGVTTTTYGATLQPAPAKLLFVNVSDPTETLPTALAGFPGALQTKINQARLAAAPPSATGAAGPGMPGGPGGPGNSGQGRVPNALTPGSSAGYPGTSPPAVAPGSGSSAGYPGTAPPPIAPGSGSSGGYPGMPGGSGGPGGAKPADGEIILTVDAAKLPTAAAIKPFLAPSLSTISVDDDGIKIISRESFPDISAVVGNSPLSALINNAGRTMLPGAPGMGGAPGAIPPGAATGPGAPPEGGPKGVSPSSGGRREK